MVEREKHDTKMVNGLTFNMKTKTLEQALTLENIERALKESCKDQG